jgi:hypothetical protein
MWRVDARRAGRSKGAAMLSLPLLVSMDTPKKYGNTKRTGVGKGRRILNLVLCVYVLSVGSNFMNFKNLSLLGTHLLFRRKGEQGVIKPLKTVYTHEVSSILPTPTRLVSAAPALIHQFSLAIKEST